MTTLQTNITSVKIAKKFNFRAIQLLNNLLVLFKNDPKLILIRGELYDCDKPGNDITIPGMNFYRSISDDTTDGPSIVMKYIKTHDDRLMTHDHKVDVLKGTNLCAEWEKIKPRNKKVIWSYLTQLAELAVSLYIKLIDEQQDIQPQQQPLTTKTIADITPAQQQPITTKTIADIIPTQQHLIDQPQQPQHQPTQMALAQQFPQAQTNTQQPSMDLSGVANMLNPSMLNGVLSAVMSPQNTQQLQEIMEDATLKNGKEPQTPDEIMSVLTSNPDVLPNLMNSMLPMLSSLFGNLPKQ